MILKRLLGVLITWLSVGAAVASDAEMRLVVPTKPGSWQTDTLKIYFELNKWDFLRDYRNNGRTVDEFVLRVRQRFADIPPDSLQIHIYAGASPEGPAEWNRRLGERRGNTLLNVLRAELGNRVGHYNIINEAARWEGFRKRIERCTEPWRDEVLKILDLPLDPSRSWMLSERELRLRRLHGGQVWRELLKSYLPDFRSSGTAVVSVVGQEPTGSIAMMPISEDQMKLEVPPPMDFYGGSPWPPCWAVKTNLLFWGMVGPNVEIEFPLGKLNRWSIEAEYLHPWWIWNANANAEQCMDFSVELRYWLGNRRLHPWLDGHHLGAAVGAGYYDFEYRKHKGYQGEYVNLYLNYGYQHRFSQHWAMDAGIGLGFIPTKYRYYEADQGDRHLIWQRNGRFRWLGPSHVHLSFVYTFNLKHNDFSLTHPRRHGKSRKKI